MTLPTEMLEQQINGTRFGVVILPIGTAQALQQQLKEKELLIEAMESLTLALGERLGIPRMPSTPYRKFFELCIENVTTLKRGIEGHQEQYKADQAEIARLRQDLRTVGEVLAKNYWKWQDAGENRLSSIVCPIVITPQQLEKELAAAAARARDPADREAMTRLNVWAQKNGAPVGSHLLTWVANRLEDGRLVSNVVEKACKELTRFGWAIHINDTIRMVLRREFLGESPPSRTAKMLAEIETRYGKAARTMVESYRSVIGQYVDEANNGSD